MTSKGSKATLSVALQNQTTSNQPVYAYITGQALDNNNALCLIQADGVTPYYPSSPGRTGQNLAVECGIQLGAPGSTRTVTIPRLAGGRVWFSVGAKLTFLLNPGPGLVEPSVSNPSDPNINIHWDFCEFTYSMCICPMSFCTNDDSAQLYCNITYVDFFSLPIAMTVTNVSGSKQHVSGTGANALNTVVNNLNAQQAKDNAGWNNLIVNGSGGPLRVLSPNTAAVINPNLFKNYYDGYVNQVWQMYSNNALTIDTQAQWGAVGGRVTNNQLTFPGAATFARPTAANIFSNSSGPFAVGSPEAGAIAARLAAAFNRSTLLTNSNQPDGENPATYYQNPITNHYARIMHSVNLDGKGYAFPYDDVAPNGGKDQSGYISDGAPTLWTITVGGANASV